MPPSCDLDRSHERTPRAGIGSGRTRRGLRSAGDV